MSRFYQFLTVLLATILANSQAVSMKSNSNLNKHISICFQQNIEELINANSDALSRTSLDKLNDLLHFLEEAEHFGDNKLTETKDGIAVAAEKNLNEINKLVNVANIINHNIDKCLNGIEELKTISNVIGQGLTECATSVRNTGIPLINDGILMVQKIIASQDDIKNNMNICKQNGYPMDCALPIYTTISSLIMQINALDSEEVQLRINGDIAINQCILKAVNALTNKITVTANCILS